MHKAHKMGYKWALNGVAFSCSNSRVNHNELRIMFGFLVPSYSPDTCLSNCMVSSQQGEHVTTVRSSDLNHKLTMILVHRHPDNQTTHTHTTIRYMYLQSHINQILAEISRTCWYLYNEI